MNKIESPYLGSENLDKLPKHDIFYVGEEKIYLQAILNFKIVNTTHYLEYILWISIVREEFEYVLRTALQNDSVSLNATLECTIPFIKMEDKRGFFIKFVSSKIETLPQLNVKRTNNKMFEIVNRGIALKEYSNYLSILKMEKIDFKTPIFGSSIV